MFFDVKNILFVKLDTKFCSFTKNKYNPGLGSRKDKTLKGKTKNDEKLNDNSSILENLGSRDWIDERKNYGYKKFLTSRQ